MKSSSNAPSPSSSHALQASSVAHGPYEQVAASQVCMPVPPQMPQARVAPGKHSKPSSVFSSQSLSRASQTSGAVGLAVGLASSQSRPHMRSPVLETLQHIAATTPSSSASSSPIVPLSQSSSCASPSQTSAFPGKRMPSASSQSMPPQSSDSTPSMSASGAMPQLLTHMSIASSQVWLARHGPAPATHPSRSADALSGSHRSIPLQKSPSLQVVSLAQTSTVPASSGPIGTSSSPHAASAHASTNQPRMGLKLTELAAGCEP
jgi:hypothetical protein